MQWTRRTASSPQPGPEPPHVSSFPLFAHPHSASPPSLPPPDPAAGQPPPPLSLNRNPYQPSSPSRRPPLVVGSPTSAPDEDQRPPVCSSRRRAGRGRGPPTVCLRLRFPVAARLLRPHLHHSPTSSTQAAGRVTARC